MFAQIRQWVRSFLHDKIGWHTVAHGIVGWKFDGFNVHNTCDQCGKELLRDSQGNWF